MGALDRYDEWESSVDSGLGCGLDGDLNAVYDTATIAAIERGHGEPPSPAGRPARASGFGRSPGANLAGAVLAASLSGVGSVLDGDRIDDGDDAIIDLFELPRAQQNQAVTVHLCWGQPGESVALVRPWLL